jgi:microcin C transport system permease protein
MKQEVLPPIDTAVGASPMAPPLPQKRSVSIFRKRVRKFKTLRRGYYSFLILLTAYLVSFMLPVLVNSKALIVRYKGEFYFPIISYYPASQFGLNAIGEPNYRELKEKLASENTGDWVMMPLYPYSPTESLLDLPGSPPHAPSREHIFCTDDR